MTKTLTEIVLSDFIEILIGEKEFASCPEYICKQIEKIDTDALTHIQYISRTGEKLSKPFVWYRRCWNTDYQKWLVQKEHSELERQTYLLAKEAKAAVMRFFARQTGLDAEHFQEVAVKIIKSRNPETVKKLCGIGLDELLKADAELQEFQNKQKAK